MREIIKLVGMFRVWGRFLSIVFFKTFDEEDMIVIINFFFKGYIIV